MDGEADDRDLLSLILVFARRGLVTVSSDEWDGSDPEQTPLVLTRRRDLPADAPVWERTLFEALFPRWRGVVPSDPAGRRVCRPAGAGTKEQLAESFSGERRLYQPQTLVHSLLVPFAGVWRCFWVCPVPGWAGRWPPACRW